MKKIIKILYICIAFLITPVYGYNVNNPSVDELADIFMGAVNAHNTTKTNNFIRELTGNQKTKPDAIRKTFVDALNKLVDNLNKEIADLKDQNQKLSSNLNSLPNLNTLSLQSLIQKVKDLQSLVK